MAYKFIDNYRERGARKKLVEHLKGRGIEDQKVLEAIGKVPRHFFLMKPSGIRLIETLLFQSVTDKRSPNHTLSLINPNCST